MSSLTSPARIVSIRPLRSLSSAKATVWQSSGAVVWPSASCDSRSQIRPLQIPPQAGDRRLAIGEFACLHVVSTSEKIGLRQPLEQLGRRQRVLIGRHLQLAVVQPRERQRREQLLRMRSCHIRITSCAG